jgi:hypothetical protein
MPWEQVWFILRRVCMRCAIRCTYMCMHTVIHGIDAVRTSSENHFGSCWIASAWCMQLVVYTCEYAYIDGGYRCRENGFWEPVCIYWWRISMPWERVLRTGMHTLMEDIDAVRTGSENRFGSHWIAFAWGVHVDVYTCVHGQRIGTCVHTCKHVYKLHKGCTYVRMKIHTRV